MTTLVIALAIMATVATSVSVVLFIRIMRRPPIGALPETPTVERSVVDAAYEEIDKTEDGRGGGIVFGLPPVHRPKDPPRMLEVDGQVETDTHPCDFLSKVQPPRFRPGECQGICWHRDPTQRGRVCFWAPQSATNCSWFQPRVRPTTVRLKKIESDKKSA